MKLDTSEVFVVNAKCSEDATVLLTEQGALFACGGNRYNRLGLDETKVFLPSHVEKALVPTRVRSVRQRIVDLDMGPNHTVCIAEDGKLVGNIWERVLWVMYLRIYIVDKYGKKQ
jgi:alpha-tubulin suppressor-like RCC1 family protein